MIIRLAFHPQHASDEELRRLAMDACKLLGLAVSHEYGEAALMTIVRELKQRSSTRLLDREIKLERLIDGTD